MYTLEQKLEIVRLWYSTKSRVFKKQRYTFEMSLFKNSSSDKILAPDNECQHVRVLLDS